MKTIGLLGGMSWESTAVYYRIINELVKQKLGGLHSAKIALVSVDFEEIGRLQREDRWTDAATLLTKAALQVQAAGADFLLICTNTMHKVAPQIEEALSIPLIHIADSVADEVKKHGISTVGLLGTSFTMEEGFYADRLSEGHGLKVLVPEENDRAVVHRIIFEELVLGTVKEQSRAEYLRIKMETLDEQTVRQALRNVIDPELGANVIDLNMVRQITLEGGKVSVELVLTAPGCPLAGWIVQQIRAAIAGIEGVQQIDVRLLDEPWQPRDADNWQRWIK